MRIAYVRVGNESIPADSIALKRLVLKGSRTSYDSLVSTSKKADFAFTKLRSVYKNRTGLDFQDSDFTSFGLSDENGYLTNAGILMADEPRLRHSRVFCTRWNGLNKASGVMDAIDDHEFTGSLISLMQDSVAFVLNNMKKKWRKTATVRIEYPDYPERAVQECIVNALIHRDYLEIGSEVHVDMFDDRLVISSPGGMPDGSLVQNLDLENVVSRRRNPVIADMFGRLDFMERRGSGFKKILEDYRFEEKFSENKTPVFRSDPYSFSVTLYNLNYEEGVGNDGGETSEEHRKNIGRTSEEHRENSSIEMNATQKKILERLAFKPDSTAVELSIQIGIARRNIEANIKVLKEMGLLVRHGSTKSGYWEVISNSNQK